MADIQFENFSIKVKHAIDQKGANFLEEVGGLLETQSARNSREVTGQTKGSFKHKVVKSEMTVYIGSDYQNALWEEFGTGEYAINGDGRKGGWLYTDDEGKTHFTRGKHPSRAMFNAYEQHRSKIIKRAQSIFGGMSNE